MPIVYACVCPASVPHEPGRTTDALARVAGEIAGYRPDTALVIASPASTPHEKIGVFVGRELSDYESDVDLAERINDAAAAGAIPVTSLRRWDGAYPHALDHFREALTDARVTAVAVSRLEPRFHFEFGRAAAGAIESLDRRVAVICSVELAKAAGARFDEHYSRAISSWDVKALVNMDPDFRRQAGENAVAQTAVLMGALSAYRIQPRVLSYQTADAAAQIVAAIDVLGPRRS